MLDLPVSVALLSASCSICYGVLVKIRTFSRCVSGRTPPKAIHLEKMQYRHLDEKTKQARKLHLMIDAHFVKSSCFKLPLIFG